MRRLNVRIIVFLDDMLLMASSIEEDASSQRHLIFILQNLGFLINVKKSLLNPSQTLLFLGVEVNSQEMTLSLPMEKKDKIIKQCKSLIEKQFVSVRELTQIIGRLSSSAIAVLPAPLQYRGMQRQQIRELSSRGSFDTMIKLSIQAKSELRWWIQNLHLNKGRSLISVPPQIVISSDASQKGWGAACQDQKTGDHGHERNRRST